MLARIDLRGSILPGVRELAGLLPRAATDIDSVLATVRPLCEDVRLRGAQAVREITARLDGVDLEDFAVPQEAIDAALAGIDPAVRAALEEAIARVRRVHADQRRTDVTTEVVPGGTVTERWLPVRRVGLYVPGGTSSSRKEPSLPIRGSWRYWRAWTATASGVFRHARSASARERVPSPVRSGVRLAGRPAARRRRLVGVATTLPSSSWASSATSASGRCSREASDTSPAPG